MDVALAVLAAKAGHATLEVWSVLLALHTCNHCTHSSTVEAPHPCPCSCVPLALHAPVTVAGGCLPSASASASSSSASQHQPRDLVPDQRQQLLVLRGVYAQVRDERVARVLVPGVRLYPCSKLHGTLQYLSASRPANQKGLLSLKGLQGQPSANVQCYALQVLSPELLQLCCKAYWQR